MSNRVKIAVTWGILTITLFVISTVVVIMPIEVLAIPEIQSTQAHFWKIRSIDTMKFSRDRARLALNDRFFSHTIYSQVQKISDIGANYIALGTPYDSEFISVLEDWVNTARKENLSIWFRGNWSGWEGWFDYNHITRDDHIALTKKFIHEHPYLFKDGDIFDPCPECENGGYMDAGIGEDLKGYNQFLIEVYESAQQSFVDIDKNVSIVFSMNHDVASMVMDEETVLRLGNTATIDHYVPTIKELVDGVQSASVHDATRVMLGEFGAPLPDIHGDMTDEEQATWLRKALAGVAPEQQLVGINYWVLNGGSTELFDDQGVPKAVAHELKQYYRPTTLYGMITDTLNNPIDGTVVSTSKRSTVTKNGYFALPIIPGEDRLLSVSANGYRDRLLKLSPVDRELHISLRSQIPRFAEIIYNLQFSVLQFASLF